MLGGRVSVWVVPRCCVRRSVRKFAPCRPRLSLLLFSPPSRILFSPSLSFVSVFLNPFLCFSRRFLPCSQFPVAAPCPPPSLPGPLFLARWGPRALQALLSASGSFFGRIWAMPPRWGPCLCCTPTLPPELWPRAGGSAPATPVPRGSPVPIASDREKKSDFCNNYSISHFLGGFPPGEQLPGPGAGRGVAAPSDASRSSQPPAPCGYFLVKIWHCAGDWDRGADPLRSLLEFHLEFHPGCPRVHLLGSAFPRGLGGDCWARGECRGGAPPDRRPSACSACWTLLWPQPGAVCVLSS